MEASDLPGSLRVKNAELVRCYERGLYTRAELLSQKIDLVSEYRNAGIPLSGLEALCGLKREYFEEDVPDFGFDPFPDGFVAILPVKEGADALRSDPDPVGKTFPLTVLCVKDRTARVPVPLSFRVTRVSKDCVDGFGTLPGFGGESSLAFSDRGPVLYQKCYPDRKGDPDRFPKKRVTSFRFVLAEE